jgi:hypothetical protein
MEDAPIIFLRNKLEAMMTGARDLLLPLRAEKEEASL